MWPWPHMTSQKPQWELPALFLPNPGQGLPSCSCLLPCPICLPRTWWCLGRGQSHVRLELPWAPHTALKGGGRRIHLPHRYVIHLAYAPSIPPCCVNTCVLPPVLRAKQLPPRWTLPAPQRLLPVPTRLRSADGETSRAPSCGDSDLALAPSPAPDSFLP